MGRANFNYLLAALLAGCGGGGGGGGDAPAPVFTVSGTVRSANGTRLPGANVDITVSSTLGCGPVGPRDFNGHTTTDASGNYTGSAQVESPWAGCSSYDLRAVVGNSCDADRSKPCYIPIQSAVTWNQRDTTPRTGVDLLAEPRFRIFGTVAFPNGVTDSRAEFQPVATLDPNPVPSNRGAVSNGTFFFPDLPPGAYTISFPSDECVSFFFTGCNGAYSWSPNQTSVTITTTDADVAFTATK